MKLVAHNASWDSTWFMLTNPTADLSFRLMESMIMDEFVMISTKPYQFVKGDQVKHNMKAVTLCDTKGTPIVFSIRV